MAVVKVYCSRCGQRVAGDETFFGTTVHCPVCHSGIQFPKGLDEVPEFKKPDAIPGGQVREGSMMAGGIIPPPPGVSGGIPPSAKPALPVLKNLSGGGVTQPMPRHPDSTATLATGTGREDSHKKSAASPAAAGGAKKSGSSLSGVSKTSADSPESRTAEEPAEADDLGMMPMLVLGSGIASMLLFWCFLIPSAVSILLGHLALMKMDDAGIKKGRNQVVTGTIFGYVSAVLFLVGAIAVRVLWPLIQRVQGG